MIHLPSFRDNVFTEPPYVFLWFVKACITPLLDQYPLHSLPSQSLYLIADAPKVAMGSHRIIFGKMMHRIRPNHCKQMNGATPL